MSFLGGLFGDSQSNSTSTSSTTQITNSVNPTLYVGAQGVGTSSVLNGDGWISNNITNTTLDGEVAIRAMDNMLTMGQDSLLFASDAQRQGYAAAASATAQGYSFATAANKAANATTIEALDSASGSMDKALAFGAKQTATALDALAGSAQMIDTAYKDAKGVLGTNVILVGIGATVLVLYFALRK